MSAPETRRKVSKTAVPRAMVSKPSAGRLFGQPLEIDLDATGHGAGRSRTGAPASAGAARSGEQIPAPSIPAVRLCRAGGPRSRADGRTAGHERPRRAAVRVRDIPGRPQVPSPVLGGHRGAESRGGLAPARGAPPQGAAAAPAGSPPGPGDNEGPVDARANRMRG